MNNLHDIQVWCGFPGVGKTELCKHNESRYADIDSASYPKEGDFPEKYIDAIKSAIGSGCTVFVSSHMEVREALYEHGVPFGIIYPALWCKGEYLKRYEERGSDKTFIELMDKNWVAFLDTMRSETRHECKKVLGEGEFVSEYFEK
jgi:hypothetical protein